MSERQNIMNCLKTKGKITAAEAAEEAGLTSMGARGHLERLAQKGLVDFREQKSGRGRPKKLWFLTDEGHGQFQHQYNGLAVELINNVRDIFGQKGLDQLIQAREDKSLGKYKEAIQSTNDIAEKIQALADERSKEGYMADVIATDDSWELIEHHCPICAVAKTCQGFCESELAVFRNALGSKFSVLRHEHLLTDGERCRYIIKPSNLP
ncbi:MAG: transcriptional regulator [Reinekea sp.]|jgi:predicted ArsR family transcriptional regulator